MDYFAFYIRHEYAFAAAQLILAMLGMGATLTVRDFIDTARTPRALLIGLALQHLGVPLIAFALIAWLQVDVGVAIGLALCAAVAGGTTSNIVTYLARGHVPLSILMTTVSTLLSLMTVPLVLSALADEHLPAEFRMPTAQIATEIALYLLLPLFLGMSVLRIWPRHAERVSRLCVRGALLVVALIVIGAEGAGRLDTEVFGEDNIRVVVLFIALLTVMSALVPLLLKATRTETAAINVEVVVRNINLALLIKASLFPAVAGVRDPVGDNVFFTALLYGGLSLMFAPGLILVYRAVPALQLRMSGLRRIPRS